MTAVAAGVGRKARGAVRSPAAWHTAGAGPVRPQALADGAGVRVGARGTYFGRQRAAEPGGRNPGGGGGIVASSGVMSGEMSSTRQGAWSMTKRVAGPRLRGPSGSRSPSRARTRTSMPSAADTTSRSIRPRRAWSVAGRPRRVCASASSSLTACSEISRSASGGAGAGGWRPSRPRRAALASVSGSVLATCSSVISASLGQKLGGLGDGGLPSVLDDPDERAHIALVGLES